MTVGMRIVDGTRQSFVGMLMGVAGGVKLLQDRVIMPMCLCTCYICLNNKHAYLEPTNAMCMHTAHLHQVWSWDTLKPVCSTTLKHIFAMSALKPSLKWAAQL